MSKKDKGRGIYDKFTVVRNDGKSLPGRKHENCDYFVLDLSCDPHSMPAILAYAESCAKEYPALAADLRAMVGWRTPGAPVRKRKRQPKETTP